MVPPPPYIPAPQLIASSRLTAQELVLHYEDFSNTLRYVSTAPELVFERLVANLNGSLKATLKAGWQDNPTLLSCQQAYENLAAGWEENSIRLQASQLAIENLNVELQAANSALRESQLANQKLIAEFAKLNEKISAPEPSNVDTAKAVIKVNPIEAVIKANPTIGTFKTSELRSTQEILPKTSKTVSFKNKYTMIPGLVVGLTLVDISRDTTVRVKGYASDIQLTCFKINLDSWSDTKLHGAACAWLEIEADDLDFQYGSYHTIEHYHWSKTPSQNTQKITFKRAYSSAPQVVVWLNLFDLDYRVDWRVKTFATDVTTTGFTLHIDTWSDTKLTWTMASWMAYPTDRPGVASGSFSTRDIRSSGQPQIYNSAFEPFASGVFEKPPRVFLALNSLEINHGQNLRLQVTADNVSAAGMTWHLDAWMDTTLHSAGASYIAFR